MTITPEEKVKTPKKVKAVPAHAKEALTIALTEFIHALIALTKVRTVITFIIIGVMSYLAIIEAILPETFMTVASAVVTYYFTRPKDKD